MFIDPLFDFRDIDGLSTASKDLLTNIQPTCIGQASRIKGLKPSEVAILINSWHDKQLRFAFQPPNQ